MGPCVPSHMHRGSERLASCGRRSTTKLARADCTWVVNLRGGHGVGRPDRMNCTISLMMRLCRSGVGVASMIVGLWRWNRSDWVVVCERGFILFFISNFFNHHFLCERAFVTFICILRDNETALITVPHCIVYSRELHSVYRCILHSILRVLATAPE